MILETIQRAWHTSLAPAAWRFARAQRFPQQAQERLLLRTLAANAQTAFGRAHRFADIAGFARFRRSVPVHDYDALEPWLARARQAEPNVTSHEPIRCFERSGGSTGTTTKLIPYTPALLSQFQAATNPWLYDLYRRYPLIGTRAYWSLSPVAQTARRPQRTDGGIPIGIDDDTAYFGPLRRFVLAQTMAVPPGVAGIADIPSWRRATLIHLLSAADLGFISVWSPTFLTTLLAALATDQSSDPAAILAALPPARAASVAAALAAGPGFGPRVWPRLAAISAWADGPAAAHIAPLSSIFPGVPVQPKGLLATEGVVSVPIGDGPGGALALTSHVLEFIDLDHPARPPLLPHELAVGASYSPVLTTGGGLYRYHLKDVVTCVAPLRVRFVGKLDHVSDLVGEKIHARQVEKSLDEARVATGATFDFALVAPVVDPLTRVPSYCLYVESPADDATLARIAHALESHLRTGHAYRYAQDLGQLGPLRLQRVVNGRARHLAALVAAGQRLGDIKPTVLDHRARWADVFGLGQAPI